MTQDKSNIIREIFSADFRSLALFRVCIGILIICDLVVRAQDLRAHYTDFGIYPRDVLFSQNMGPYFYSLHFINGSLPFQAFLFLIAGILAILMILGYKTRLVTFLSWIMLCSLHSRNFMILIGGDLLLRVILFFSIFTPLGASYSIDSALSKNKDKNQKTIFSAGTFSYFFQVSLMYFFTWLLKSGTPWKDGTATYNALQMEEFTTTFGHFLCNYPDFLKTLTHFTWYLELLGSILLFCPFMFGKVRTAVIFLYFILQAGFGMCLRVGIFPFVSTIAILPLIPPYFWERLNQKLNLSFGKGIKIYFTEENELVKKLVLIVREFLLLGNAEVLPSSALKSGSNGLWMVEDLNSKKHYGFKALKSLCEYSFFKKGLLFIVDSKYTKEYAEKTYNSFVSNKNITNALSKNLNYGNLRIESYPIENTIALIAIVLVSLWNIADYDKNTNLTNRIRPLVLALRLDQRWNMFAPFPRQDDGWYVFHGNLVDGTDVDPFRGKVGVTYEKPKLVSATYSSNRWRKYLMEVRSNATEFNTLSFGRFLCRRWNAKYKGDKRLSTFKIFFMKERILPGNKQPAPQKVMIWRHYCLEKPAGW